MFTDPSRPGSTACDYVGQDLESHLGRRDQCLEMCRRLFEKRLPTIWDDLAPVMRNSIVLWYGLGNGQRVCPRCMTEYKARRNVVFHLRKYGDECFREIERDMEMKLAYWGEA